MQYVVFPCLATRSHNALDRNNCFPAAFIVLCKSRELKIPKSLANEFGQVLLRERLAPQSLESTAVFPIPDCEDSSSQIVLSADPGYDVHVTDDDKAQMRTRASDY